MAEAAYNPIIDLQNTQAEQGADLRMLRTEDAVLGQRVTRLERTTTALAVGGAALAIFNLLFFVAVLVIGSVLYATASGGAIAWMFLTVLL